MRDERGMSLVEILVAAFVITVGLVAVSTGMQLGTAGVAAGQQQTTASFLAEQRLEVIKSFAVSSNATQGWANVTATNFPAAEAYGSITNYPSYRRTTTITTPTATTKRVTVSVFWLPVGITSQNAERTVTVSVLLAARE